MYYLFLIENQVKMSAICRNARVEYVCIRIAVADDHTEQFVLYFLIKMKYTLLTTILVVNIRPYLQFLTSINS